MLVFLTGLGTVTPSLTDGTAGNATTLYRADTDVMVYVGGQQATVVFKGQAPGFPGLYQLNVTLPQGLKGPGNLPARHPDAERLSRSGGHPDSVSTLGYYAPARLGYSGTRRSAMANLDWSLCPAVESIPGKVSGAWVFRNTRMPVSIVFENLESGATIEEIMDWFHLTREQIVAVLEFAARSLDPPPSAQYYEHS